MLRPIRIFVDIPALDRLVAFLEAGQQKEIDGLTTQVSDLTRRLQQSQTRQDTAVKGTN